MIVSKRSAFGFHQINPLSSPELSYSKNQSPNDDDDDDGDDDDDDDDDGVVVNPILNPKLASFGWCKPSTNSCPSWRLRSFSFSGGIFPARDALTSSRGKFLGKAAGNDVETMWSFTNWWRCPVNMSLPLKQQVLLSEIERFSGSLLLWSQLSVVRLGLFQNL